MSKIEDLRQKVDFLLDIVNLSEIAGILPSELVERSRNRMKIERLKKLQERTLDQDLKLQLYMDKELNFQEKFKKVCGQG